MRISDWSSDVCSSDLTVPQVRRAIAAVLEQLGIRDAHVQAHAHGWRDLEARPLTAGGTIRPAYFCSGCPHNTSTRTPDGELALGGIGCPGLAEVEIGRASWRERGCRSV